MKPQTGGETNEWESRGRGRAGLKLSNTELEKKFPDSCGIYEMSRIVRKPDFCLCENKGADQLRGNREADQRLCFRYTDSTLSLLIKSEISSFYAASGTVHVGL